MTVKVGEVRAMTFALQVGTEYFEVTIRPLAGVVKIAALQQVWRSVQGPLRKAAQFAVKQWGTIMRKPSAFSVDWSARDIQFPARVLPKRPKRATRRKRTR